MSDLKTMAIDYLTVAAIVLLFLTVSALDDSYENAVVSAQVLDEAIAQADERQKEKEHVLPAHQDQEY